ncbi:MAG: DNA polymerase III subunit delta [Oscillospiraceae bacterium]|nr:DNA polymerase III subunit delta [Oscillospiraceae bacterium]
MPLIDEDGLSRLLKTEFSENRFLIFGDDGYLKEVYSDRLIKAVIKDDNLKFFNFHTYQDDETSIEDIFEDADNLPVMANKTLLLIKNYPLNELSENGLKEFEEKLKDAPETSVLAFYYSSQDFTSNTREFPKWTAVIELFKRVGTAAELSHRSGKKIVNMLIKGASSRNTSIGEKEAAYLIEICGEDTGNLLNEFNKLCAYAAGEKITKEMIDACAVKSVEASVFDISSSIFSGNADRAFQIVLELLRQKTPVQSIMGALNQSYMTIYRYKAASNANKSVSDFADAFGYKGNQSFVFSKIAAFANKTDMNKIRRSLDVLIEADIKSKSTSLDPSTLLTEVIAKLSAIK